MIGVAVLASLRLPRAPWSVRLYAGLAGAVAVLCLLPVAASATFAVARDILRADDVRQEVYVADELTRIGLEPGDPVVTDGFGATAWTRLARVRIVAEVPWGAGDSFWSADPETADHVLSLFQAAGARVVLAHAVPEHRSSGWVRIERTDFYYRVLH